MPNKDIHHFNIDHELTDLNKYINKERAHRNIAAATKKKLTHICSTFALAMRQLTVDTKYNVLLIHNITNNRIDPDNLAFNAKFILDGVVKAGKLKDDSHKYINIISHVFQHSDKRSTDVYFYAVHHVYEYLSKIEELHEV